MQKLELLNPTKLAVVHQFSKYIFRHSLEQYTGWTDLPFIFKTIGKNGLGKNEIETV